MDKKIIVVDLDSTVHEYMHTVALVALNDFGIRVESPVDDWTSTFPAGVTRDTQIEIFRRCHDREYIFLTKPYPGAVSTLQELCSEGYSIWYVSDRKSEAFADTVEWLTLHGFPTPPNLHCSRDKREFLGLIGEEFFAMFDDRPRTMIYARYELGLENVYSLKHEYNKNLTDIPGIHLRDTWDELLKAFREHSEGSH